jgi:membrane fusion protein (multidrug efflux system)
VAERYARAVRRGQPVTFRVAAFPDDAFTARVEFTDPVVALPARTILIKALADNRSGHLQPGMFVEARLATAVRPRRWLWPRPPSSRVARATP